MKKIKGIVIGYSYFGANHKNFKILIDNGVFSNYFIYKTTKIIDNSYEKIEPYNIVEFFINKSKIVSNVNILKSFDNINKDYKKFFLISIFSELLYFSKVDYNTKRLFNIFYSFLNILNKPRNISYENYLVFIFSYVAVNSGYFNLEGICKKCGKKLDKVIYFSLNDFLEKCVEHKIPYSFKISINYFNYYNLLLKEIDKKLIIPNLTYDDAIQMIKFFKNFYNILFEGKKIKSFKFINNILKNQDI